MKDIRHKAAVGEQLWTFFSHQRANEQEKQLCSVENWAKQRSENQIMYDQKES